METGSAPRSEPRAVAVGRTFARLTREDAAASRGGVEAPLFSVDLRGEVGSASDKRNRPEAVKGSNRRGRIGGPNINLRRRRVGVWQSISDTGMELQQRKWS